MQIDKVKFLEKSYNRKHVAFKAILAIILACVCFRHIREQYLPVILGDEVGYWTGAAFFLNIDWSSVMSKASYFGYGYGIILVPLLFINNAVLRLRMALAINILMLCAIFWIGDTVIVKLKLTTCESHSLISAFVSVLYPFFLFYAHSTQAEIFLSLLFVLTIYMLVQYTESEKICYLLVMQLFVFWQLGSHSRTIGIVLIDVIFWGYLCYKKKIRKHQIVYLIVELLILIGAFVFLYNNIKDLEYSVDEQTVVNAANTFGGQSEKLKFFLSWSGIMCALDNILGRIFYFCAATFFVGLNGLIFMLNKIIHKDKWGDIYLFLILSLVIEMVISSIFMIHPARMDTVIHGRYFENIIYFFIAVGFSKISEVEKNKKILIVGMLFICIYALRLVCYYHQYNITGNNWATIVGVMNEVPMVDWRNIEKFPLYIALNAILFGGFWGICACILKKNIYRCGIVLAIGIYWVLNSEIVIKEQFTKYMEYNEEISEYGDLISEYVKENEKIYYYYLSSETRNHEQTWTMYRLRFIMPFSDIEIIDLDNLENKQRYEEGVYILHKGLQCDYSILEKHSILWEDNNIYMLRRIN